MYAHETHHAVAQGCSQRSGRQRGACQYEPTSSCYHSAESRILQDVKATTPIVEHLAAHKKARLNTRTRRPRAITIHRPVYWPLQVCCHYDVMHHLV